MAFSAVLAIAACGGGGSSSSGTVTPVVQVSVAPTSATVDVGTGTQTFSATVTNSSNTAVSWQVGGVTGGNTTVGLISTAGVYSAPASMPSPTTVTVTAVTAADPTKQASAMVSLIQPTVSPPGAPSVPGGLAASNISPNSDTLSWTASTDAGGPGIGGYYVYRNGNQIATVSTGTSYSDTALVTSTTYSYQVAAFDTTKPPMVSALSSALALTTLADTQAPTVPSRLAASNVSTSSLTLTWTASTDLPNPGGAGVGGYIVYRNGTQIASVTNTSYADAGLAPSISYSYTVAAFDKAIPANLSAASAALLVMTAADTQPPTAPSALSATAASSTQINLSWTASSDNVGVTNYLIERCQGANCKNFAQIATFLTTTYNDTGLTASSSYSYRVRATDAAGNLSPYSNTATAITSNPGTIGNVQSAAQDPTSGNTLSVPYAAAQLAGDLNVVVVGWSDSTSSVTSVTDSKNNTYLVAVGPTTNAGNATQVIYYAQNIAAGANTVTVNFNATVNYPDVRVLEYSGVTASSALDVGVGASGSGTSLSSGAATTSNANDLLVGANYIGGGFAAAGSGYTARLVTNPDSDLVEDRVVSSTGSYSASSTQSPTNWWVMQMAAFRTTGTGAFTTITPRNAALTLLQTQQFTTNAPGGTTLIWSVDGLAGGNSTVGTVSNGGLYTPPASAGTHTVSAANAANPANTLSVTVAVTDLTGVTTWHNDVARTGQNLKEYALTPTTVSSGSFGKRWSCPLDGTVYAQPLYVANVSIGGGTHNVLFVATMHDTIYAFDADNPGCVTYWTDSFISPSAGSGITTISSANAGCLDIVPEYGITGTPVIDPSTQTIYLVTSTSENNGNTYVQRLHALNIATGAEKPNSPVVIQATVPGTGDGSSTVSFNPLYQNQRAGLALTGGGVVIGWGSRCDNYLWPWYGWEMRYDASSLTRKAAFNVAPNGGGRGGIWMAGGAPALDSQGNMFVSTGNGTFDDTNSIVPAPNNDFGESFLNLNPTTLAVQDFYTPSMNSSWTTNDLDISAGGITVLPDGAGPSNHPNVLIGSDKQGHLWMIDRSSMSGYNASSDNTVQYLALPGTSTGNPSIYGSPGYWNGNVYISVSNGPLMALQLSSGLVPASGLTQPQTAVATFNTNETYGFPGPTPMISASASGSGAIVWVLDNNTNGTDNGSATIGPAILRAYDANNLGTTLYSSDRLGADTGGNAAKFTLPVVANGHVYVAGTGALTVYGLVP